MDQVGYILELYGMQKKIVDLGQAAKQLLPLIIEKKTFTTYQCYKELNKQKKISYKNVHKRVKKLYEFGILKKVSTLVQLNMDLFIIRYLLMVFIFHY